MFELNKYQTKNNTIWITMIHNKSSIVLTHIDNLFDIRVFNEKTLFFKNFSFKSKKFSFVAILSEDGNEFDINISSKKNNLKLNLYYSIDSNLVISVIENKKRREITTIPYALLI